MMPTTHQSYARTILKNEIHYAENGSEDVESVLYNEINHQILRTSE